MKSKLTILRMAIMLLVMFIVQNANALLQRSVLVKGNYNKGLSKNRFLNETSNNAAVSTSNSTGEQDHNEEEGHDEELVSNQAASNSTTTAEDSHEGEEHHDEEEEHHDEEEEHHDENHDTHDNEFSSASNTSSDNKPWGAVIGAALLTNLCSLIGVVFILPCLRRIGVLKRSGRKMEIFTSSFAAGALMAAALLLILPESSMMMLSQKEEEEEEAHAGHEDEPPEVSWKFGVSVLIGFLIPFFFAALAPKVQDCEPLPPPKDGSITLEHTARTDAAALAPSVNELQDSVHALDSQVGPVQDVETAEPVCPHHPIPTEIARPINWSLCFSILLGDMFHNFSDGIFLGSAFLTCGSAIALSIMVATIYHEMIQELADFVVLTKHAGLSVWMALLLNFTSGLSVVLGGVIVLAADLSTMAIGALLSMSAGVYLNIAAVDCLPRVSSALENRLEHGLVFLAFGAGAIPIGLVLLNHEHCV